MRCAGPAALVKSVAARKPYPDFAGPFPSGARRRGGRSPGRRVRTWQLGVPERDGFAPVGLLSLGISLFAAFGRCVSCADAGRGAGYLSAEERVRGAWVFFDRLQGILSESE